MSHLQLEGAVAEASSGNLLFPPGQAQKSSEEQNSSSGGMYVLSSQVFLFVVATGCSCNLLTTSECFPAKPFLATVGIFLQALE